MVDLGDLREGFWDKDELLEAALLTENELHNLKLAGSEPTWVLWRCRRHSGKAGRAG